MIKYRSSLQNDCVEIAAAVPADRDVDGVVSPDTIQRYADAPPDEICSLDGMQFPTGRSECIKLNCRLA
jgi:hypothetical protein